MKTNRFEGIVRSNAPFGFIEGFRLDEKFEGLKMVLKNIKSNKTGGDLYQHL